VGSTDLSAPSTAGFSPVLAQSGTTTARTGATSYDCSLLVFIRAGTGQILGEFSPRSVRAGDLVVLAPAVASSGDPDYGGVSYTTMFLDADFMIDTAAWQFSAQLRDRYEAQSYLASRFPDPVRVVHLGVEVIASVAPWLDELTTLSVDGDLPTRFLRAVALAFSILDVIEPFVHSRSTEVPERANRANRAVDSTIPRHRSFAPLRAEARQALELLRSTLDRQWTMEELAAEVDLSPWHLRRVFVNAFGKTPHALLTQLRAEHLATLLRDPDLSTREAMRRVGWHSPDYATRLFRRYVGMSPRAFRTRYVSTARQLPDPHDADLPGRASGRELEAGPGEGGRKEMPPST
jgi:AraC family transcriptional regulator